MQTEAAQLDDEPKAMAAGEKDARKHSFNKHRLVGLVSISCLEKI